MRFRSVYRWPLTATLLIGLGACSVTPREYAGTEPTFRIEDFFQGQTQAWGMFQDRSGKVRRRFQVDIDGYREGDVFVLEESFRYADGRTDSRTWRIETVDNHHYRGTAGDIVGEAEGTRYGNALNWRYTLALTVDGETWNVGLNDWMYLVDDRTMINRATMSKFGVEVGQLTLFFRKPGA